jgi:hypothetical protein
MKEKEIKKSNKQDAKLNLSAEVRVGGSVCNRLTERSCQLRRQ